MKKKNWFSGLVSGFVGLASLSAAFASVPKNVTNDTALSQKMSEIKVSPQKELNFDRDIAQLASSEGKYREKLPGLSGHPRLKGPVHRVGQRPYHYSGHSSEKRSSN